MRLAVGIPSTFTGNLKNRAIRARVIGELARFLALFRVTELVVFHEPDEKFDTHGLGRYIVKLLKYAVTPPPLKKLAFPLEETDRWFGVIPPLEMRIHREGWIGGRGWGVLHRGVLHVVERGHVKEVKDYGLTGGAKRFFGKPNGPLLVPVERNGNDYRVVSPLDLTREMYIGFYPRYFNRDVNSLVREYKRRGFSVIATSRKGEPITEKGVRERVGELLAHDVLVLFGGPFRGLMELGLKGHDILVNVLPDQELETIHTQEAVALTLYLLEFLSW